jgi:hypothetical protein
MSEFLPVLLAAPGGGFSNLGNTFHQEGAIVGWQAVGIIVGTATTLIGMFWLTTRLLRARQKRSTNCPWQLFKELCAAHDLSYRDRQLLTQLAQQHRLEQPAMLFVEPTWWEADKLGRGWQRSLAEIHGLRDRLFATL